MAYLLPLIANSCSTWYLDFLIRGKFHNAKYYCWNAATIRIRFLLDPLWSTYHVRRSEHLQPFETPGQNPDLTNAGLDVKRAWVATFSQSPPQHLPISGDSFKKLSSRYTKASPNSLAIGSATIQRSKQKLDNNRHIGGPFPRLIWRGIGRRCNIGRRCRSGGSGRRRG
jgi:hypothetical protein